MGGRRRAVAAPPRGRADLAPAVDGGRPRHVHGRRARPARRGQRADAVPGSPTATRGSPWTTCHPSTSSCCPTSRTGSPWTTGPRRSRGYLRRSSRDAISPGTARHWSRRPVCSGPSSSQLGGVSNSVVAEPGEVARMLREEGDRALAVLASLTPDDTDGEVDFAGRRMPRTWRVRPARRQPPGEHPRRPGHRGRSAGGDMTRRGVGRPDPTPDGAVVAAGAAPVSGPARPAARSSPPGRSARSARRRCRSPVATTWSPCPGR